VTDICSANGGDGSYCNNSYGSCCGTENYTTQYASGTCQNYALLQSPQSTKIFPKEPITCRIAATVLTVSSIRR